jgi:hypothetical protein
MNYEIAKDAIEDAVQNRKLAKLPDDKGLSEAHKIICKGRIPITEHPDVQRLIGKQVQLQAKYDTLKQSHEKLITMLNVCCTRFETILRHKRTKQPLRKSDYKINKDMIKWLMDTCCPITIEEIKQALKSAEEIK